MANKRTEADNYAFLIALIEKTGEGKPKFAELVGKHPGVNTYMNAYHWFNSIKNKAGITTTNGNGNNSTSTPAKSKSTPKTPPSKTTTPGEAKRGRGRPKKAAAAATTSTADGDDDNDEMAQQSPSKKRKLSPAAAPTKSETASPGGDTEPLEDDDQADNHDGDGQVKVEAV